MFAKLFLFTIYLFLAYLGISILNQLYRKTEFFNKWTIPKYHYLLLLDMELMALMIKNHIINHKDLVAGFEDLKGNVLSATKVKNLFHKNNLSLNLGFGMNLKHLPNDFICLTDAIIFLFESISNINKKHDLYIKSYDDINKVYLTIRQLIIFYQSNQNKFWVDLKQYNGPKTLKETCVIKFLTI